ncbi:MAG: single-stranded-DNA-specific exonuclease RecJ [Bosea sp. (in: a-proteobacteria)]
MSAQRSLFLEVARSALGRPWRQRLDGPGLALAENLVQVEGLSDTLARVLAARGVTGRELTGFLEPRLRDLMPDPATLTDMAPCVTRLTHAVSRGEHVAIFGDYDVDGACSSALLARFLEACGARPRIHIPDRLIEGYGPNTEAIRMLAGEGATLLVAVDCGTTSHEPFAEAMRLGMDVLVLDHHQAPVELPTITALVNPNRQDDLSGLGHLCAAGVVFMALVALSRALREAGHAPSFDLLGELDLVALATVADVAPLVGLNRAFVRQGLTIARERTRPGLAALMDVSGLNGPLEAWHFGFLIGPRINAGGRIGDASLGAKLLTLDDDIAARDIAVQLNDLNRDRQEIERAAVEEAFGQVEAQLTREGDSPVIVAASPDWHPGIVGLVASRLKERFRKPAFAFAMNEAGGGIGSGRSVIGVDLGRAVRQAAEGSVILKGGGHAMAAGATLASGGLAAFSALIRRELAAQVHDADAADALMIDASLTAGSATPRLVAELAQAGPFGSGSPEPMFVFPRHRIIEAQVLGAGGHVRIKIKSGDGAVTGGVAFRSADQPLGQALMAARGTLAHVAATLSVDRWGGGERAELRIADIAAQAHG